MKLNKTILVLEDVLAVMSHMKIVTTLRIFEDVKSELYECMSGYEQNRDTENPYYKQISEQLIYIQKNIEILNEANSYYEDECFETLGSFNQKFCLN
jgi:hypothetical protein